MQRKQLQQAMTLEAQSLPVGAHEHSGRPQTVTLFLKSFAAYWMQGCACFEGKNGSKGSSKSSWRYRRHKACQWEEISCERLSAAVPECVG